MRNFKAALAVMALGLITLPGLVLGQWVPLPPVGNGEEVGPGGCAARGRGYTFVAIGNESDEIYAFKHSEETWYDMEPIPGDIVGAGAMAYEHHYGERLFVVADDDNCLWIYTFRYPSGLEGTWDEEHPIELPEGIEPGVALAFQPDLRPLSLLSGILYLLADGGLYKRAFDQIPIAVDALGPENGAVVATDNIFLDWLPHPRWNKYHLQVSLSPDFTQLLVDTTVVAGEFSLGFLQTGTYYWRVRGCFANASSPAWSEWSATMSFSVGMQKGVKSVPGYRQFPDDGLLMAGDKPVFDWASVSGAVAYRLQVALNPDFFEPVIDVTVPASEFISDSPLQTGDYFWRTCWQDAKGKWSEWGPVSSFIVQHGWVRTPLPFNPDIGAAMCYAKGSDSVEALYVLVGGNSRDFYRYLINNSDWQQLAPTLAEQYPGASITPSDAAGLLKADLRAIMGVSTDTWYRYVFTNRWYPFPTVVPRGCGYGSAIIDQVQDDYYLVLVIAGEYEETNFYKWIGGYELEGPMAYHQTTFGSSDIHFTKTGEGVRLIYTLKQAGILRINLFDPAGRKVRTLFDGFQPAGEHSLQLNSSDFGKGVYFFNLDLNGKSSTLKVPVW